MDQQACVGVDAEPTAVDAELVPSLSFVGRLGKA